MVAENDILYMALQDDDVLKKHIDEINAIVKEFPYFQSAWAASVRYLKLQNTFFSPALQQTTARSIDRSHLFEFVNKLDKAEINKTEEKQNENVEKLVEKSVVEKTILPESKAETIEQKKRDVKQIVDKKETSEKKEVLVNKQDSVNEEQTEKKEIVVKKDKSEEEDNLVKKSKPVKIIRPIPRTITNAIPKKLIKIPEKEEGKKVKEKLEVEMLKKESKPKPAASKVVEKTTEKKIEKKIISNTENVSKPKLKTELEVEQKPITDVNLEKTVRSEVEKEKEVPDSQPSMDVKKTSQQEEKLSYAEWLQRYKNQKKKKKKTNIDLIEKFLRERPKIVPKKNVRVKPPEIIEESVAEKQMLMTETLANLYVKQKKYEKAIQAFRILSLKYPKKSSYFANQIKEIEQKLK